MVCKQDSKSTNCLFDMCSLNPDIQQPCVIIIGAGMAGLSAAKRLVQCGITNFKILEASERPGGRIKTCWLGDAAVEMGPDVINGASIANPVYTMAAQEGLFTPPLTRLSPQTTMFFTSDGRAIDVDLANKASATFKNLEAKAANLFFVEKKIHNQTLSAYLDSLIVEELKKLPEIERYDTARIFYGMSNGLKSKIGEDLDKVSSTIFGSLHSLPGGDVKIPLGMGGLLAPLLRNLPRCAVHYCKPVQCIRWGTAGSGVPRVVVRCCDGEEFPADYVIVTVSLGVLKNKADLLFCPGLPAGKMEAIRNLGFGNLNKIFIYQESPFWVPGTGGIRFAWSPQELAERGDWVKGISGLSGVEGSGKVLQATVAGEEARIMESKSDAELVADLNKVIQSFMGNSGIKLSKDIMRTDWSTNQFFCGAFTYLGIDSTVAHIADLANPLPGECDEIPPIILFAGEHTSIKYFSTLHGARESGIREADRIVSLTKKLGGPPFRRVCIPCKTRPSHFVAAS